MTVTSVAGHRVERIECDPDRIWQRGTDMEALGDAMIDSADVLQKIKDGDDGSIAQSLDDLRDAIGDLTEDLKEAGRTYQLVGPELVDYADVLREGGDGVLRRLNDAAEEMLELWTRRQAATDAIPTGPMGTPDTEDPDFHDKKAAADALDGQWEAQSRIYDAAYNSWSDAYDKAVENIGSFNDDGIEDSWLDDVHMDAIVGAVQVVLAVVGVALVALALVVSAPLAAVLAVAAVVVGVIALGLTIYQQQRGEADGGDVAWAIAGVLPFGKLGKVVKLFPKAARALRRAGGSGPAISRQLHRFNQFVKNAPATRWAAGQMKDLQRWARYYQQGAFKDPLARALFGVDKWTDLRGVPGKQLIAPFIGERLGNLVDLHDVINLPGDVGGLPGQLQTLFGPNPAR